MPDALPTVDIPGIEILSEGGPIHGVGSPPEGDYFTRTQLEEIAAANRELADEVRAPNKIGHSKQQALAGVTPGEIPAMGWLDGRSFRVEDRGGVAKLVADARAVPAKFADLLKARAWRTRSVELASVTSQATQKRHDWAVTGLAWLGGKLPAVQTLDDVVALYETGAAPDDLRFVAAYEQTDDEARAAIEAVADEALRAFVADLVDDLPKTPAAPADSRASMTYTTDQRRKFAEATGLEEDKVSDEMLAAAGVAEHVQEPAAPAAVEEKNLEQETRDREFAALKSSHESLAEELRLERRTTFVEGALRDGRVLPGGREKLERLYDADPQAAREFVASLPVNEDLAREYGTAEAGDADQDEATDFDKAFEADLARRLNVKPEELI